MAEGGHYYLEGDKDIRMEPAQAENCISYIVEVDDQPILCVIEGGAFHRYRLKYTNVARLASECAKFIWTHAE